MRKAALVLAAVAVAVASSLTACSSGGGTPTETTPAATTTTPADETADVCSEAKALNTSKSVLLGGKFTELQAAQTAGDQTKVETLAAEAQAEVTDWATKLNELADKDISPAVKTALTDAAQALAEIGPDSDPTETQTNLLNLITGITTACG